MPDVVATSKEVCYLVPVEMLCIPYKERNDAMSKLAVNGGKPLRDVKTNPWPKWPLWDEQEEKGLLEVLRSGLWSYNGPKELEFNKAFAEFIGSKHALSVANGTVSLQLALEACGIGLGDEVIVPGLTWQADRKSVV